jgi:hypothetical protein
VSSFGTTLHTGLSGFSQKFQKNSPQMPPATVPDGTRRVNNRQTSIAA